MKMLAIIVGMSVLAFVLAYGIAALLHKFNQLNARSTPKKEQDKNED